MNRKLLVLVPLLSLALFAGGASAAPAAKLIATYQAQPPTTMGSGAIVPIAVTLTNTGDEPWLVSGATPVNLSYHWYDSQGVASIWNGARAALGADVPVGGSRLVTVPVTAPPSGGSYFLRFALVKEGVAWFDPSAPYPMTVTTAFQASFGPVVVPPMVAGSSATINVTATNTGTTAWNATGANAIALAYHWHDAAGATVVWDGVRSPLTADVAPGAVATIAARITAPPTAGTYVLTLDFVREGVGWFAQLGGTTPFRQPVVVAPVIISATYSVAPIAAYIGEQRVLAVTVVNTGNQPIVTTGPTPVNLSYHLLNAAGQTLVWDGPRTALGGDLAPGASRVISVTLAVPNQPGSYTFAPDLVREGVAWYSGLGSPYGRIPLTVTSGLDAGYGASTTPAQATIGATLRLTVQVTNYGPRTWPAAGPNPVRLSYHLFNAAGQAVVWDGARGALTADVPTGQAATVTIDVTLPQLVGKYVLSWDLVQEGVSWFSSYGVARKDESITVQPGVTFYGSGFGHGLGMSQYGAQGLATGAIGAPQTGEQIVAHYYRGTTLMNIDLALGAHRVLLSAPSSTGRYTCGMPGFNGTIANVISAGGFRVINEGSANAEIGIAGPNVTWQIAAKNGVVEAWNQSTVTKVYTGAGPIVIVPIDPNQQVRIQEKGLYRGNFKFTNSGGNLRLVNYVGYDDYVRGVIPKEMPTGWHLEAYKAQAYAARTYAYSKYAGGSRDYDSLDDQQDQCYGGRLAETAVTDAAAAATAGKVIAYNGAPIRAYFASSNGGYTMSDGCWGNNLITTGTPRCSTGAPYLNPVPDPADRAVSVPAANRNSSWTVSFTSAQIRDAVMQYKNFDIGSLLSVDVSNRAPVDVGHVISVKVQGTGGIVDLAADVFLRTYLGLKSTMVRLSPF